MWEAGRGKSLMLLASNNKSWSYLLPCLIKYLEKKTLWLIRLLHWSSIDCAPFCCPSWVNVKWWLSRRNKLLATTRAETKMNSMSCREHIGSFRAQSLCRKQAEPRGHMEKMISYGTSGIRFDVSAKMLKLFLKEVATLNVLVRFLTTEREKGENRTLLYQ